MALLEILVWTGAGLSVLGLLGLVWCIVRVAKAKRANLSDDELRAAIQSVVPINMGALFLSVIGLMLVVVGVFLS
ncbi:hypothetical protein C1J05_08055 [Sulfitobacter sp. JL08]|uniref:hypothetical protein n=1 Tax=Sulfitobacter sp. JL08 TaxID=2070369 RepID=UPI000E0C1542|nr:hypothetical protein [Sulfitobacter sp. JL08]AXI54452.1 hypothetical protein C1J05_08055 [Sulfitobacter sp. JL08]